MHVDRAKLFSEQQKTSMPTCTSLTRDDLHILAFVLSKTKKSELRGFLKTMDDTPPPGMRKTTKTELLERIRDRLDMLTK